MLEARDSAFLVTSFTPVRRVSFPSLHTDEKEPLGVEEALCGATTGCGTRISGTELRKCEAASWGNNGLIRSRLRSCCLRF